MTLTKTDLLYVVRHLPRDIRALLQADQRLFVAGGFIREVIASSGGAKDIDLFGQYRIDLAIAAERLRRGRGEGSCVISTANAITVLAPPRMPVQFITRWTFDNAADLLASLDFTVCQAAVWHQDGEWLSACAPTFYSDLAARRLVYTTPQREEEPGGSLLRVRKFLQRGYNIQPPALAAVTARLLVAVRAKGLGAGTEGDVAQVLTGLLYEVDPNSMIDGLEPVGEQE